MPILWNRNVHSRKFLFTNVTLMEYIMDGLFQLLKLRDVIRNVKFSRQATGGFLCWVSKLEKHHAWAQWVKTVCHRSVRDTKAKSLVLINMSRLSCMTGFIPAVTVGCVFRQLLRLYCCADEFIALCRRFRLWWQSSVVRHATSCNTHILLACVITDSSVL